MNKKTAVSIFSGVSALILAATCLPAMAFGSHGHGHHRHGGDEFGLYARADGISHETIQTAFQNSNVRADFQNVRKDKNALDTCIIANSCTTEVTTYETDQAKLTSDKLTTWQSIFKGVNTAPGVSLKTSLDQANAAKHAAFKTAFGGSSTAPTVEPSPQQ
jgi:hypothetical protein